MALITLEAIISLLHTGDIFSRRNDKQYWSGWISGDGPDRKVAVTQASLEAIGLELKITDKDKTYDLKAVPADASHTHVLLDGKLVEGASMVFAPKPSIGDVTRWAFDFRPIPLDGKQARFNMRYDP